MNIVEDHTSRRPRSTPEKMEFQYVTTTSFAIAFELVVGDAELDPIEGYQALIAGMKISQPPLRRTLIRRTWTEGIVDIRGRFRCTPAQLELEKKNRADLSFVHAFHLYDNSDHNVPIIEETIPLDMLMTRGGEGIIQAYGLEPGTTYTASVRCYNNFGSAAVGINGTLTTLKQLPKYSYQHQELSLISISVNPIPGRFMVLTCTTLDKNHESLYKDIAHKRQTVAEIKEQVKHLEEAVEKRKLLKRDLLMQRDLLERRVSILKRELEIRFGKLDF
ncbi:unnamed protein product [Haemonchus placei]|uniref:Fibronectin type-III domain-containing protein n=1 Tax=Haemonchus placei TaxID=6290 RepID=A0A0N4WXD5_HAEPC|nr:unnamed protein product [Haemonchus placei]